MGVELHPDLNIHSVVKPDNFRSSLIAPPIGLMVESDEKPQSIILGEHPSDDHPQTSQLTEKPAEKQPIQPIVLHKTVITRDFLTAASTGATQIAVFTAPTGRARLPEPVH